MEREGRGASFSVLPSSTVVSDGVNKSVINNPAFGRALRERYELQVGTWYWLDDLLGLNGGDGLGPIFEKIMSAWTVASPPADPRSAESDITIIDLAVDPIEGPFHAAAGRIFAVISETQAWILRDAALLQRIGELQAGRSHGESLVAVKGLALLRALRERDEPSLRDGEYLFLEVDQNGAEFRLNSIEPDEIDDVVRADTVPADIAARAGSDPAGEPEKLFAGIASFVKVNPDVVTSYGFGDLDQVPFKLVKGTFSGGAPTYFYSGDGAYETHNQGFAHILTHYLNDRAAEQVWFFRGDAASYAGLLLRRNFDESARMNDGRDASTNLAVDLDGIDDLFLRRAISRSGRLRETLGRLTFRETHFAEDFVRLEARLDDVVLTTLVATDRDRAVSSVLRAVFSLLVQNADTRWREGRLVMRPAISERDIRMVVERFGSNGAIDAHPWRHNPRLPDGLDVFRLV